MAHQPSSPEGYMTVRITKEQHALIREQLGIFSITIGGTHIPVVIDKDLPSGVIVLRSHSPYQDVQINLVTE